MDALIKHVEQAKELNLREIYAATEMLLSENVSDQKKVTFLRGLTAQRVRRLPRLQDLWRLSLRGLLIQAFLK